jgi:hypothetical protein
MVRAYAARRPQLEARESLQARLRVAAGSGSLNETDAREILRDWQQQAKDDRHHKPTSGYTDVELKGFGIGVRTVQR